MEATPKAVRLKSVFSTPCNSVESSPCESKGGSYHSNLSASLKQRLKRSRRSFTSPSSVAKRLCVDDAEEENGPQVPADSRETVNNPPQDRLGVDANRNGVGSGRGKVPGPGPEPAHPPPANLSQQREQLTKAVKDKTEMLRRLNMVKMYRSKNDLTQLQTLIGKWRSCAQAALYELQSDLPTGGQKASLSELIDLFGLNDSILHFDRTEEDFTT
ncbi:swi5-dependent recombination DNA repair protein 1 homolog [Genypterus blacodes]|uniref:swi5-dependent recombination DNA repair protein 1 homolog n=1 Tax=Genypterus blacodes TaxID=154954 RepID=UPI003F7665CB